MRKGLSCWHMIHTELVFVSIPRTNVTALCFEYRPCRPGAYVTWCTMFPQGCLSNIVLTQCHLLTCENIVRAVYLYNENLYWNVTLSFTSILITWFTSMYEQIVADFTYAIYLIAFSWVIMSFFNSCIFKDPYNNTLITLNMRGPSYLGLTRSISWLLMLWLLVSPGHPEQWYWLCRIGRSLSYLRKVSTTCVISIRSNDVYCKYMFKALTGRLCKGDG